MKILIVLIIFLISWLLPFSLPISLADEFRVYQVFRPLNMGEPGEFHPKDIFINMGSSHGVALGSKLQVFRRIPTFDQTTDKIFQDATIPIGTLKVIHVEAGLAIARVETVKDELMNPLFSPHSVMVGDSVRPVQ